MITKYENGKDFLDDNKDYLLSDIISCQLVYKNASSSLDINFDADCFFFKVSNDNEFILFSKKAPYRLTINGQPNRSLMNEAIMFIKKEKVNFNGIIASKTLAELFISLFVEPNYYFKTIFLMDILVYKGENAVKSTRVKEIDFPVMSSFSVFYKAFVNELNLGYSEQRINNTINKYLNSKMAYGLFIDNKLKAIACISRSEEGYACISGVYTEPNSRKKGLCQEIVGHVTKLIIDQNKMACLFVDQKNPISNEAYYKVGYRKYIDQNEYSWEKKDDIKI